MNKDFMLLNDNTIEITNEYGQEINRGEFTNNNIRNFLLAENKVEIINKFKEAFERELIENKKVLKISSSMLKLQAIMIIIIPFCGFLFGAISNPNTWIIHGIYESICALIGLIIPITITTLHWSILRPKYKKNIREMERLISKSEDIKKEYEEKLQEEKQKNVANLMEPLVKVSLEKETNVMVTQVAEDLRKYTDENIKQRGKVKIRKR